MKRFSLVLVLICCLALSHLTFAATQFDEPLQYLASFQDESSGGLKEEALNDPQLLQSSWGAMAFAASGYNPSSVRTRDTAPSLLTYALQDICQNNVLTDIERAVLVASASGLDPKNIDGCSLTDKIDGFEDPISGKIGADTVSTVFGVLSLHSAGETIDEKTLAYILQSQQADGGWDSGWGTEANFTAQTLQALALSGVAEDSDEILTAKNYLKSSQTDSGGIKYDNNAWTTSPDAFSDAYTLQAIYVLGESPTDIFWQKNGQTILDDLASLKNEDGSYSFSSDFGKMNPVWTTSVVLIALNQKPLGFLGADLESFAQTDLSPTSTQLPSATPTLVMTPSVTAESSPAAESEQAAPNATFEPEVLAANIIPSVTPSPAPTPEVSPSPTLTATSEVTVKTVQQTKKRNFGYLYYSAALLAGLLASSLIFRKKKRTDGREVIKVFLFSFGLVLLILFPRLTFAAGRAGALVLHSDGSTKKACVSFEGENVSSFALLQQAGFNPVLERGFLVELDSERAKSAWEANAVNDYWSFWNLVDGSWQYSRVGVTSASVKDGEANGWQRGASTSKLPALKFSDICPDAQMETHQAAAPAVPNEQTPEPIIPGAPPAPADLQTTTPAVGSSSSDKENPDDNAAATESATGTAEKGQPEVSKDKKLKTISLTTLCFLVGFSIPILIRRLKSL